MANYKGNRYPVWAINVDGTVIAIDAMGTVVTKSKVNFAVEIGIGNDGTVWVVSNIPDSKGAGAKIFWSNGNGVDDWNEIDPNVPGGIQIAGTLANACIYITEDNVLFAYNENKSHKKIAENVLDMDYGPDYYWALMPLTKGQIPVLQLTSGGGPFDWKPFEGNYSPTSITVNDGGLCFGLIDGIPTSFSTDGKTVKPLIPNSKQTALQISSKTYTTVILSLTDQTENGNLLMVYTSSPSIDPVFEPVKNIRATKIAASYFVPV